MASTNDALRKRLNELKEEKGLTGVPSAEKQVPAAAPTVKDPAALDALRKRIGTLKTQGSRVWVQNATTEDLLKQRAVVNVTTAQMAADAEKEYNDYIDSSDYIGRRNRAMVAQNLGKLLMPGVSIGEMPLQNLQTSFYDEQEQTLRAKRDYWKAQAQKEADEAVLYRDLRELDTWPAEDREALKTYIIERDREFWMDANNSPLALSARMKADALFRKYGEAKVNQLAESYSRAENAKTTQDMMKMAEEGAEKHPIAHSAASVAANVIGNYTGTMGAIQSAANGTGRYQTLDPDQLGNLAGSYAGTVRKAVSDKILGEDPTLLDQAENVLYQGTMSFFDNGARALLGGGNKALSLGLAASGSFGQSLADASRKGADPLQATALAAVNAGLEVATEYIPLENLLAQAKGSPHTLKEILKNVLKQGGIEAAEEEISLIGSALAEMAILGEKNQYRQQIAEAVVKGIDYKTATRQAWMGLAEEAVDTLLTSWLSGSMSTGSAAALYAHNARQVGKALHGEKITEQEIQQMIDYGYAAPEDSRARAIAQAVQMERVKKGDLSNYNLGGLYLANVEAAAAAREQAQTDVTQQKEAAAEKQEAEGLPTAQETAPGVVQQAANTAATAVQTAPVAQTPAPGYTADGQLEGLRLGAAFEDKANSQTIENGGIINGTTDGQTAGDTRTGTGAGILPGGGQRYDGAGTGQQTGKLAGGAGEAAPGTGFDVQQGKTRNQRNALGKILRLEWVSTLSLGIDGGTERASVQVIPEEHWDDSLRQKAEQVYQETGKQVVYVLGALEMKGKKGTFKAKGAVVGDRIYVQANHTRYSAEQIADHEAYHGMKDFYGKKLTDDKIVARIKAQFTKEEMDAVLDDYIDALSGVIDVEGSESEQQYHSRVDAIWEEILADAYAGMNSFGAGATRFTETVNAYLEENNISRKPGAENGTRQTNGPNEQNTAPEGGARFSYGGEGAGNADLEELDRAKQMEAMGISNELIRQQTGWFRGMDGKWRWEIDDSGTTVTDERINYMTLGELLPDAEVFKAYPDLKDISVVFQSLDPGVNAQYNRQMDHIDVSYRIKEDPEAIRGAVLHEIQHAIQNREGFTHGASVGHWERRIREGFDSRKQSDVREAREAEQKLQQFREEDPEFYREMMELDAMAPDLPRGAMDWDTLEQIEEDPPEWQAYDARRDALEEKYGDRMWDFNSALYDLQRINKRPARTAEELYFDTAGEIEARNVAGRRNLNAEERRKKPPILGGEDTVFAEGLRLGAAFEDEKNTAQEGGVMPKAEPVYTEYNKPISEDDIATLRTIGKISVNAFTSEDIQKAQKWAYKFYDTMQETSPFFRAWFGEWRENSDNPVTAVREKSVGRLENGRAKNRDVGIEMSWNAHNIISETINHAARDRISVKAINQLAEIVENAILLDTVVSMPTSKSKMKNTAFMHSFYAVYNAGAETYIIKLYAEMALNNRGDTVFTRAYQLKDIKKVAVLDNGVLGGKPPLSDANTATINTVAELVDLVKRYDPDYSPKPASKVVNRNGTPKVMYHGTRAENGEFYVFDESKAVKKGGLGMKALGKGNYFTAKKLDGTERYGSRVIPVYLDIKTPFVYNGGNSFREQVIKELGLDPNADADTIQQEMRNRGYDGVIQYDKNGEVSIAVTFDSNQIKSATENIGTFDGGNPDIRYSVDEDSLEDASSREERFRALDAEYQRAVSRGDMSAAKKLVDRAARDAGYAIKAYHGTDAEAFNEFDKGRIGESTGVSILGDGFYFADNKKTAKQYGKNVYAVYLKQTSPYAATAGDTYRLKAIDLEKQGYDGVVLPTGKGNVYMVLDPNQIKSAEAVTYDDDGNVIPLSQRFNPEETDIRYSVDEDSLEDGASQEEQFRALDAELKAQGGRWNDMWLHDKLGKEGAEQFRQWRKAEAEKQKQQNREIQKQKRQDAMDGKPDRSKMKPVQESRPILAKKELKNTLFNLFSIPSGEHVRLGGIVDSYADRLIKNGVLTEEDRRSFFTRMYEAGVMKVPANEYFGEARAAMRGGRIGVPESIVAEFGDDWNDIRKRAFASGIYLTRGKGDTGIDVWNQELAGMLPGLFDTEETDLRSILERIVQVAEEGKDEHMSLPEYTAKLARYEGISEKEFLNQMERQLDWALRTFASNAKLEVKLRDRTGIQIARERARNQERAESQRADKELRELQQKTLKSLQWLKKNQYRAPEELKQAFEEVLGDIDVLAVGAANEMNWSDKYNATWKDLAQMYKEARESDPNFFPSKDLENIVMRLDGDKIADLDVGALQDLYKAAVGLRTEFYNRNNVIGDELHRIFEEVYADSKKEIKGAAGKNTGKFMDKLFNMEQLTPMNVMQRMGGWDPNGVFYSMARQLEKGERDMRAYKVKAQKQLQEFLTEHEEWVKKADGQGEDAIWYELEVPQLLELRMGHKPIFGATVKVQFTPAQKVHMYLESKNQDNLRHMVGGRTFADKELYSQGERQEAFAQGKTIRLAPETVKKICSDLTEEERQLAELLEQYYNRFATDEINRVSNILYGYDKAMGKNYAPIYTNQNYTNSEFGIFDTTAEGIGNLKGRQHSKNPSYNIGAFDAFEKHMDHTARFVGMAIPARNWTTLMNWQESGNSMGDVITHKWGDEGKQYIEDLITTLQGGDVEKKDSLSSGAAKLQSNYITAIFGANPSIVLKQLGSIPMASAYLGAENVPSPDQVKEIDRDLIGKYTQELDWRTMGYTTPETKTLKDNPNWTETNPVYKFWFGGGAITAMDGWAASTLWPWAENKVRKEHPELEIGTQEQIDKGESPFYKKVAEEFENALNRSQSVSDEIHQSSIRKSKNPITKAFTMFRSDSAQTYNTLRQKIGEAQYYMRSGAKEETVAEAKKAVGSAFVALAINALWAESISFLMALWKNKGKYYRDDEEELTAASIAGEMASNVLGSFAGTVTGGEEVLEVIGNILTGDKLYDIETPGMEQLNDVIEVVSTAAGGMRKIVAGGFDVLKNGGNVGQYLANQGGSMLGHVKDLAQAAAMYIGGIPVSNMEAYLLGALKWVSPTLGAAYDDAMREVKKTHLSELSGNALGSRVERILKRRGARVSEETADVIAGLYEAGYKAAMPADIPGSVSIDGVDRELKAYQKQVYGNVWSGACANAMDELTQMERFLDAPADLQEKMLKKIYDYAADQAKSVVFGDYSVKTSTQEMMDAIADGLSLAECAVLMVNGGDLEDYSDLRSSGVDEANAYALAEDLAELEPLPGKDYVTEVQKWRACVDRSTNVQMQLSMLAGMMGDQYYKAQVAYDYGVSPDAFVTFYEIRAEHDADGNGSYTNAELKAAIDAIQGLTDKERAALWQVASSSKSAKNNPYDSGIGEKVLEAKTAAKNGG